MNDKEIRRIPSLIDLQRLKFSLWIMPIMVPLAIFAEWDTITAQSTVLRKVIFAALVAVGTYISAVILFWWNALAQGYWKSRKDRKSHKGMIDDLL